MAYVCICNDIKESDIKKLLETTPNLQVKDLLKGGIGDKCCKCVPYIRKLIKDKNYKYI